MYDWLQNNQVRTWAIIRFRYANEPRIEKDELVGENGLDSSVGSDERNRMRVTSWSNLAGGVKY
jgi:hypothetical protein